MTTYMYNTRKKKKYGGTMRSCLVFLIVLGISACTDFLQIDPPKTFMSRKTVFENDKTAEAAITATYYGMRSGPFIGGSVNVGSFGIQAGRSADEFEDHSASLTNSFAFFQNELLPTNPVITNFWRSIYNTIYRSNAVIEGLENSANISSTLKSQLIGEAKFIRAFHYFYLVNMFGDVPLITSTDYTVNALAPRASIDQVYKLIISDLLDATEKLNDDYVSNGERTRANKTASEALLARAFLYLGKWSEAEIYASKVIANCKCRLLPDLNDVFLANSEEAIWQLIPANTIYNTYDGSILILAAAPTSSGVFSSLSLTDDLIQSFEANDLRKINWISSFVDGTKTWLYPFKYKVKSGAIVTEYIMMMRLAEQYLIRAEARAQQSNLPLAISDVDAIRNRAGLPLIADINPNLDKDRLIDAIVEERRTELFAEWGHRWLDLNRTGRVEVAISSLKPATWQSTDALYPIPESDLLTNPNLIQNPGY